MGWPIGDFDSFSVFLLHMEICDFTWRISLTSENPKFTLKCQDWHRNVKDGIVKVIFDTAKDVVRGTHATNGCKLVSIGINFWKWVGDVYQKL